MKTDSRISYQGGRWPNRDRVAIGVRIHHRPPSRPLARCVCVCSPDFDDKRS